MPELTGGQVTLRGLGGRFPESLRVARLEVRDDKGLWLTADDVALDWAPLAYLWNTVSVENVAARRIDILRRPIVKKSSEGSSPHIVVDALKVDRLNVTAAVAWRAASVTLSGKLDYASLDEARIDIVAQRLDAPGVYRMTGEDGEVRGLSDFGDQVGQDRLRIDPDEIVGRPPQGDQTDAEGVPAVRELAHVAAVEKRPQ